MESAWYALSIMLHIAVRPRSLALAPFIKSLHYHEGTLPAGVERIIPNAQAHLMVNLHEDEFRTYAGPDRKTVRRMAGAVLAGPHGRAVAIDTEEQRWLMAVEFRVGGASAFLRMPLSETRDRVVELGNVWGRDGGALRERLCEATTPEAKLRVLEAVLSEQFVDSRDRGIAAAASLLDKGMPLFQARSCVGMLPKTFARRFSEQVGLTPKRMARVRRLQRLIGSLSGRVTRDWCRIAAEHGYTDQAHLIHEFRDLAGMTPTAYHPSSPQRRNHVPLAPLR